LSGWQLDRGLLGLVVSLIFLFEEGENHKKSATKEKNS
jgi:hypothetical protein